MKKTLSLLVVLLAGTLAAEKASTTFHNGVLADFSERRYVESTWTSDHISNCIEWLYTVRAEEYTFVGSRSTCSEMFGKTRLRGFVVNAPVVFGLKVSRKRGYEKIGLRSRSGKVHWMEIKNVIKAPLAAPPEEARRNVR